MRGVVVALLIGAGILAVGAMANAGVAGAGWEESNLPGVQVRRSGGTCTEARISSVPQFIAWANANQEIVAAMDAKLFGGDPEGTLRDFFALLGCPYNPDMVIHRIDGTTVTPLELLESLAGAVLGPNASTIGLVLAV